MMRYLLFVASSLAVASGCSGAEDPPRPATTREPTEPSDPGGNPGNPAPADPNTMDPNPTDGVDQPLAVSIRPRLTWKRYHAFESDLARGLELPAEELCTEFGGRSCIREVHLVALGGHEPFATGMLESAREPLGTTPTVVDRVVLSACSARVARDLAGEPAVFTMVDLAASSIDSGALRAMSIEVYHRFLARDPSEAELEVLESLRRNEAGGDVPASDVAKSVCYAVATTTEFLFF